MKKYSIPKKDLIFVKFKGRDDEIMYTKRIFFLLIDDKDVLSIRDFYGRTLFSNGSLNYNSK